MFKKIKRGLILAFIILSLNLVYAANQDVNDSSLDVLYDIRGNSNWQNNESVEIVIDQNSTIIFDAPLNEELEAGEICQLTLTDVQRVIKSAVFSLRCFGEDLLPFTIKKDISRDVDLDFDDRSDLVLSLEKIDLKEERITLSISKFSEKDDEGVGTLFIVILILTLLVIILDYYYHHTLNKSHYKKIKEKIGELEGHLSLKDHEKAGPLYEEIKSLYKRLKKKQKKELHTQISESFKQFEGEEDIISKSKL